MLIPRVVTAVVLLAILGFALAANNPLYFLTLLTVLVGLATFEWLRLTVKSNLQWVAYGCGIAIAAAAFWLALSWTEAGVERSALLQAAIFVSAFVWLTAVPVRLYTVKINHQNASVLWSLFAPITLFATFGALAAIWLVIGTWYLLSLLALIWIADIAAYFGGRQFGRRKLAPQISPGKTREGAVFGVVGVLIWLLATAHIDNSFAQALLIHWGWLGVLVSGVLLGVLAIMGDLFESYLKRQAGVKDSSGLLPGHGGVYDRVDAVVAVVPVAYLLVYGVNA